MALKTFTGEIAVLNPTKVQGRNGPITAYSAKIVKPDGEEYDEWVGFGFKKPVCERGDSVVITAKKEKGYWKAVDVEVTAKADPDSESGDSGTEETQSDEKSDRQESSPSKSGAPNKDTRIQYQHSQEMALLLANLLLSHKAVPLTATAGKGGEAARFEEITALVRKLTVELQNDVSTGRLMADVEDSYEAPEKAEAGFDGEEDESDDE